MDRKALLVLGAGNFTKMTMLPALKVEPFINIC
jgi:hypothetical protein